MRNYWRTLCVSMYYGRKDLSPKSFEKILRKKKSLWGRIDVLKAAKARRVRETEGLLGKKSKASIEGTEKKKRGEPGNRTK